MMIDRERKESEFIWTGELSASGRQEPNAISCGALKMYNAHGYDA